MRFLASLDMFVFVLYLIKKFNNFIQFSKLIFVLFLSFIIFGEVLFNLNKPILGC